MSFNIADLFEHVADAVPERVAVVSEAGHETYRELDERSTQLAHVLRELGAVPGATIGCYMQNSAAHVEVMLACYKLRAVPVNVNTRYVADELAYVFDDADLLAVVHDASVRDQVLGALQKSPQVRFVLDVDEPAA